MKWRRAFRAVHRDTGYVVAALTIAYAISGIAVNHIEDWNPNYAFSERPVDVGPLPDGPAEAMQDHVIRVLDLDPHAVRGHFMENDFEFRVFLPDGQEIRVDRRDGRGSFKHLSSRAVLYELNAMHLNTVKGLWTWIADLFAVSLLALAVTGIFMMKGPRGILGRGKWFVAAGLLIPAVFVWYMVAGG
jgi:hypothetical protein